MLVSRLQKFLTAPEDHRFSPRMIFWLTLSLVFSISFAIPPLQKAFSGEYLIMDDARQHLFWMQRFVDPDLFPNDLIADFYQSITPAGVSGFYHLMANLGINPLLLNKIIPLFLGLLTTIFCFGICIELLPVPTVGFIGSLLLNQNLWLHGELTTAVSSGFAYPAFLSFLYFLLRRSPLGVGICMAIMGNIYGPLMLIAAGVLILRLIHWEGGKLNLSNTREDYMISAIGLGVATLVIIPYFFSTSEYGPTISAQAAKTMPEFLDEGRTAFFYSDSWLNFWFKNSRSGIRISLNPPLVILGFFLPILFRFPGRFPLVEKISSKINILLYLILTSIGLFAIAHLLLFKLFLPSRYTSHSFRIILAISTAIVLIVVLDGIFQASLKQIIALTSTVIFSFVLIFYPVLVWGTAFPRTAYIMGTDPAVYQFLQQQPKDTLTASLSLEADNLPIFSQRSVLASWEHALPYQQGYYRQIKPRVLDLISAQYSPNLNTVQQFIQQYGVDYFLIDQNAFTPEYITENVWFKQWPDQGKKALSQLQGKQQPILLQSWNRCTIYQNQLYRLVKADCLIK